MMKKLKVKGETKKKKVKKLKPKFVGKGLKIVDEDSFAADFKPPSDSDDEDVEDLPQIADVVDERPVEVQVLESFNAGKWKRLADDPEKEHPASSVQLEKTRIEDFSPPRRKDRNSPGDISPPRRRGLGKDSNDLSPPRRKDRTPPRRRKGRDSSDIDSPPRRRERNDDFSPPRRRYRKNSNSASPPRRQQRSPPQRRERRNSDDLSPPRRRERRNSDDLSPPRRRERDISPPRRKNKRHSDEDSPPRNRKIVKRNDDSSPPRRRPRRSPDDVSPPRRRTEDLSPPRKKDRRSSVDVSPPRKRGGSKSPGNRNAGSRRRDRVVQPEIIDDSGDGGDARPKVTLDGKKAGLQKAGALRDEMIDFRKREKEIFEALPDEVSGRNAKAIKRDRRTEEDIAKEIEKERKEAERKEQYDKWGKGLKQVEEREHNVRSALHEMAKPLARYKDDDDLDDHLKSQDREGDPMLEYLAAKRRKAKGVPEKPKYAGPPPPPNRFNIPPGFRWDGVDRSNGYEKQWFTRINAKKAIQEEAYKWSVEDL